MHCVLQTDEFREAVKRLGLSENEVHSIETTLSENPQIGEIIKGTGGARKWRVPTRQKGKRGGYRVITYFAGQDVPVFLLEIFSKGERIDLTQAERNELRHILGGIAEDYRASVKRKVARLKETGT